MTETQLNAVKGAVLAVIATLGTLGVLALPVANAFAALVPALATCAAAFLIKRPKDSNG